jgi:hypothetical protein
LLLAVRGVSRSDGFVRQFRQGIFNNEVRRGSPEKRDEFIVQASGTRRIETMGNMEWLLGFFGIPRRAPRHQIERGICGYGKNCAVVASR